MKRIEHNEPKWKFPFVEYSCNEKKENLPLIIQLHGAGERGCGNEELNKMDIHGLSGYLKENEIEAVVIMPQCPSDTFWVAKLESLIEFIEDIIREYKVDEDRVYLTGLSMGGYGTWYTAMARPDLFAAIAPMCGGGMAWNARMLTMPVWAFHGVDDPTVSVTQSDEMVSALKELGRDVTYTRMEGVNHNVWQYGYNEKLIEWFLSKKKAN